MPIIGKLDKQVNDILIAPLANPNASAYETHQHKAVPQDEKAHSREIALDETTRGEKIVGAQASLPVWLL